MTFCEAMNIVVPVVLAVMAFGYGLLRLSAFCAGQEW